MGENFLNRKRGWGELVLWLMFFIVMLIVLGVLFGRFMM